MSNKCCDDGGLFTKSARNTQVIVNQIPVEGIAGTTPHIGENGNWWIGTVDTGVPATQMYTKTTW